ncbi:pyrroloquinoline quinone biosynthesis protein PqqB [Streptomyces sp. CBMA29]|uniref:pyrroloquinoline quinone biosynthesis protein PqqB n=1 Tax=Streptomyces sp. CBMA29 TaxID=1896314 RepID=UPI001661B927|nr:MBL fold metallo-hydrolase [Streptomyces sp. CBMA29]MBD0735151.1 pyrroloquinoline quinone biosynthesis protein PqqB [Streptomyces sp. CBMA29]
MLLHVLGTAAGGAVPQWNCACTGCSGARTHPHWRRRHAALAVTGPGEDGWLMVNATPDITDQMEAHPGLRPGPAGPRTPVVTIVLTDAELDHTLGIARLREASRIEIHATEPVRWALRERLRLDSVLAPYTDLVWRDLPLTGSGATLTLCGTDVTAVPLSDKRPRYAADGEAGAPWVTALRLSDPGGGATALYAPALARWSPEFATQLATCDCVLLDGTFWDDDEPVRAGFSARTARGMGHLPITGDGGTAERLSGTAARCLYTHLNNTNPLVDPDAPQHEQLRRHGLEAAQDGMVISL